MKYSDARPEIKTGDLIAVTKAHNWLGTLTQLVTRSPYTHVGVARWLDGGLYMAEINGGRNHLIPTSQLTEFDVYEMPAGLQNIEEAIDGMLRTSINYSFVAFIVIGLRDLLRLNMFIHWRETLVCSGYCVAIYEAAGWGEHNRMVSPGDLAAELKLKFEVREGS